MPADGLTLICTTFDKAWAWATNPLLKVDAPEPEGRVDARRFFEFEGFIKQRAAGAVLYEEPGSHSIEVVERLGDPTPYQRRKEYELMEAAFEPLRIDPLHVNECVAVLVCGEKRWLLEEALAEGFTHITGLYQNQAFYSGLTRIPQDYMAARKPRWELEFRRHQAAVQKLAPVIANPRMARPQPSSFPG